MEYQVTKIETYWVTAEDAESAAKIVKSGKARPESTEYEVNG